MATTSLEHFQLQEEAIKLILFELNVWLIPKVTHMCKEDLQTMIISTGMIELLPLINLIPSQEEIPDDMPFGEVEFYSNNLKKCLKISDKFKKIMATISAAGDAPEIANILGEEQYDQKEITKNFLLLGKKSAETANEYDDVMEILAAGYQPEKKVKEKVKEDEEVVYSE